MVRCAMMAWSAADGRGRDRLLERVQRKSHRQVDLISLIPKPKAKEEKKPQEKEPSKPEEKKEEPQIVTVVLKVHMHCNAYAQEIKKRILKMKGMDLAKKLLNALGDHQQLQL